MPRGQPGTGPNTQLRRQLEVIGARQRLRDLRDESRKLLTMYPELANDGAPPPSEMEPAGDVYTRALEKRPVGRPPKPKRVMWNEEQRAAISKRMKAYHRKNPKAAAKSAKKRYANLRQEQEQARLEYEQQRVAEEQSGKE